MNRVKGRGVRIGEQRPPAGDIRGPDGQPSPCVGVVNGLFHRKRVGRQVAASEGRGKEKRVRINGQNEDGEERRYGRFHALRGGGFILLERSKIAAASTKRTGPQRETDAPGTSSSHSIVWRPAGTRTAEKASCAGEASAGRPSRSTAR